MVKPPLLARVSAALAKSAVLVPSHLAALFSPVGRRQSFREAISSAPPCRAGPPTLSRSFNGRTPSAAISGLFAGKIHLSNSRCGSRPELYFKTLFLTLPVYPFSMIIGGDLEEVMPSRFTKVLPTSGVFVHERLLVGRHHFPFISPAGPVLLAKARAFGSRQGMPGCPFLMSQTGDAAVQF